MFGGDPGGAAVSRLKAARDRLIGRYRANLPPKIAELRGLLDAVHQGDDSALDDIRILAHRLRGSGGSFNLPEITERACALEHAKGAEIRPAALALIETLEREARKSSWPRARREE